MTCREMLVEGGSSNSYCFRSAETTRELSNSRSVSLAWLDDDDKIVTGMTAWDHRIREPCSGLYQNDPDTFGGLVVRPLLTSAHVGMLWPACAVFLLAARRELRSPGREYRVPPLLCVFDDLPSSLTSPRVCLTQSP